MLRFVLTLILSLVGWGLFYGQEGMTLWEIYRSFLPLFLMVLGIPEAVQGRLRFLRRLRDESKTS